MTMGFYCITQAFFFFLKKKNDNNYINCLGCDEYRSKFPNGKFFQLKLLKLFIGLCNY